MCAPCEHGRSEVFPLNSGKSTTATTSFPLELSPHFLLRTTLSGSSARPFRLQLSKSFGRVMCQLVFRRTRGARAESRRARRRERPQGRGREGKEGGRKGARRGAQRFVCPSAFSSGEAFSCSLDSAREHEGKVNASRVECLKKSKH